MLAHVAFSLALLPGSFAALVAPSPAVVVAKPLITPGPSEAELRKRQNAADYMGVVLWSGTWSTLSCSSGTLRLRTALQVEYAHTRTRKHVLSICWTMGMLLSGKSWVPEQHRDQLFRWNHDLQSHLDWD
jgi:hypothetical protein